MHDPRIGRFFAVDPLDDKYPYNSPYAFSENKVIHAIELEGLESKVTITDPNYIANIQNNLSSDNIDDMVTQAWIYFAYQNGDATMELDVNEVAGYELYDGEGNFITSGGSTTLFTTFEDFSDIDPNSTMAVDGGEGSGVNYGLGKINNAPDLSTVEGPDNLFFPLVDEPLNVPGGFYSGYNYAANSGNQAVYGAGRSGGRTHAARDLYTDGAAEVRAMTGGRVLRVAPFYLGTYQIIIQQDITSDAGTNMIIRYGELGQGSISVKAGDRVEAGQVIGKTGSLMSGGSPLLTIKGKQVYMLHIEMYSGELGSDMSGSYLSPSLTQPGNMPAQRRNDVIDPLPLLRQAHEATFGTSPP